MPSQTKRGSPSKRRAISPETEAEREAKRVHTESHIFDETKLGDILKYEDEPGEGNADAPTVTLLRGSRNNLLETNNVHPDPTFDSLDESIRVLALSFHIYHGSDDLVHGAFRTILKRRLEFTEDKSDPETPKLSLYHWLEGLLGRLGLSAINLNGICSALKKAEMDHVVRSWSSRHSKNDLLAALELLQELQGNGEHTVSDVVEGLRASDQPIEPIKSQTRSPSEPTAAKKGTRKTRLAKPVSKTAKAEHKARTGAAQKPEGGELASLTTEMSSARRAASDQKPVGQTVLAGSRGKSAPLTLDEERQSEPPRNNQFEPSSSPAIVKSLKGHGVSPNRIAGKSRTKHSSESDSKMLRQVTPATPLPSKSATTPSTLVRYIKPDGYNILLFFIGPNMSDIPREEIADACFEAFGKQPLHTHLWSGGVWVAQMNGVSGVFTNVLTLQNVQLAAKETNSDPKSHFVAYITGFEVEDDVLRTSIEDAVAQYHPNRSSGGVTIYQTPHIRGQGSHIFLVLAKPPPKPLLPILVPGTSDAGRYLIFKPALMDCETPCFYCGQVHEELICVDARQMSRFVIPAERG